MHVLSVDIFLHELFEIQLFVFDEFPLDAQPLLRELLPHLVSDLVILHATGPLVLVALDGAVDFGLGRKNTAFLLDNSEILGEDLVARAAFLEKGEQVEVGGEEVGGEVGEIGGLLLERRINSVKGFKALPI